MEQRSGANVSKIKIFYDSILNSGDLEDIYPQSLGDWSQDERGFIKYYMETLELENEIETDPYSSLETTHLRNFKDELGLDED